MQHQSRPYPESTIKKWLEVISIFSKKLYSKRRLSCLVLNYLLASLLLLNVSIVPLSAQLQTQALASYNGDVHTPKGDLHMLVIFVRYEDRAMMRDSKAWPNVSKEGVLPQMAIGEVNDLFNARPETIGQPGQKKNLSDLYYLMSGGTFRLTADIFPVQVPIKYNGGNFFSSQRQMNKQAVDWIVQHYPDFDWSKYDNRSNKSGYAKDNSQSKPDKILDYVIFMHRAPGSTGMGSPGNFPVGKTGYMIRHGHTGLKSYSDAPHNWEYFNHEFSHNLFTCPHYLGANSTDGNRFYTQKGWGFMSAWHAPFFTSNAWESWWLGWIKPQEVTEPGRYELKDFATEQDAIRMKIPGTNDYLWIENHQKKNHWDEKLFFNNPENGEPKSAPGIYMYVVGNIASDRAKPRLSPFNPAHCNFIKVLNAAGNFDFAATGDSLRTPYFLSPLIRKGLSNPIAGQNEFQFIRADYNKDGKIKVGGAHGNKDRGPGEQQDIWTEQTDKEARYSLNSTGDANDALVSGDLIGHNGTFPIVNYPTFSKKNQLLSPYLLNGISIEVIRQKKSGAYVLAVKYDDWKIKKNTRWCGSLKIAPQYKEVKIALAKNQKLILDLSGTPNRETMHSLTRTCANPTRLDLEANQLISLEAGSELELKQWSELYLKDQAKIVIKRGASLIVRAGCKLYLEGNSRIEVRAGGKLIVEEDAKFIQSQEAAVEVKRKGSFEELGR